MDTLGVALAESDFVSVRVGDLVGPGPLSDTVGVQVVVGDSVFPDTVRLPLKVVVLEKVRLREPDWDKEKVVVGVWLELVDSVWLRESLGDGVSGGVMVGVVVTEGVGVSVMECESDTEGVSGGVIVTDLVMESDGDNDGVSDIESVKLRLIDLEIETVLGIVSVWLNFKLSLKVSLSVMVKEPYVMVKVWVIVGSLVKDTL
jgi:hypothetical protein